MSDVEVAQKALREIYAMLKSLKGGDSREVLYTTVGKSMGTAWVALIMTDDAETMATAKRDHDARQVSA